MIQCFNVAVHGILFGTYISNDCFGSNISWINQTAKIQLIKLQKAAAAEVDALIGKIGKVTLFSGISITKARKAYDALTEGSKAYVSLIDTLLAAEKAFAPLRIVFWSGIVAIAAAGGIATVLVVNKRKAAKVKKEETVE